MKKGQKLLDAAVALHTLFLIPGVWHTGSWATTKNGTKVPEDHPEACHFCISGGINRIAGFAHRKTGEERSKRFGSRDTEWSPINVELRELVKRAITEVFGVKTTPLMFNDNHATSVRDINAVTEKTVKLARAAMRKRGS